MNARILLLLVPILFCHFALAAENPHHAHPKADASDSPLLTVDRIYGKSEFHSKGYTVRWDETGATYLRLEKSAGGDGGQDIVRYDAATGKKEIVVSAGLMTPSGSSRPLSISGYSFSHDEGLLLIYTNSKRVWRRNSRGDYWVLDRGSRQLHKLGGDAASSTLMFAKFSPNAQQVAYVRERNIYIEDLRDHTIRALTKTPTENIINGTFDWVYEEELGLRDGFRFSPDGASIAFWQLDTNGVPKFPLTNNTDALYPSVKWFAYPKVGQKNSASRIGVVHVVDGATRWMNVPGDSRNHYIARMNWAGNSNELVLQQLNRRQNTNRVMLVNVTTATAKTILTETDPAWLDINDEMIWFDGHRRFTWISERDGWRHVYLTSRTGGKLSPVAIGNMDVIRLLHIDEKGGWIYFMASPENPTQSYLYCSRLDGQKVVRLTPADQSGTHRYQISADGRFALHSFSSFGRPSVSEFVSLPDHKQVRKLEDNQKLRDQLKKLKRGKSEFFRVAIDKGIELDGWLMLPPNFKAKKKYPVLVYVYGEPAGQTVVDRFGGSGYLWHLMMTQRGYVVVCIDNMGTPAPKGRAWRKAVHHKVGIIAPQQQAAAIRELLRTRPYLDPARIGVWGWSGGGSMTLNAMFKFPDLYHTGVAIAPVPNQRYYDTIYQERYMGLPGDNAKGFIEGSPITYAKQLKGNLLLIHGTGDDNCHYQTTQMLINELVKHNKRFTMMAYPNRTHSISEGKNTTVHLRSLMTRFLLDHLPPGPVPRKKIPPIRKGK